MDIGIVVVTHSYDFTKLYRSIHDSRHCLKWYFHHHGPYNAAARSLCALGIRKNVSIGWHFHNRGLSKSWNDGIEASRKEGNDVTLLINDDITFDPGAFDLFMAFVAARGASGLCLVAGREPNGVEQQQGLACCAIGRDIIDGIGAFDENFVPAYYEDLDYLHRVSRSGLPIHLDERVLVFHQRNGTSKGRRLFRLLLKWQQHRLRRYYRDKWGIVGTEPTLATPFGSDRTTLTIAWDARRDPYRHIGRGRPIVAALMRWASVPRLLVARGRHGLEGRRWRTQTAQLEF